MSAGPIELCDALLYRSTAGERERMFAFFNLISNAVTYGMVMGSARTGLGTENPVGHSIPGDSLYYQALQAYSAFDWELQSRLLAGDTAAALPAELAILAGRFRRDFIDSLVDERLKEVELAQRIACTVAPSLKPFELRRLAEEDQSLDRTTRSATFSSVVRDELWRGSAAKLDAIARIARCESHDDLAEKLAAMASAFVPLSTVFAASFDAGAPSRSFTRLSVYMPALHTLRADDIDDPSGWYLERGVAPIALPVPVQVSAASITHVGYLRDADDTQQQGLRFEVRRRFCEPQTVTMVVGFGHFFASESDDLLGFACGDPRDSMSLLLRVNLPIEVGDSAPTREVKERFNRAMSGFEVEARIHQLTLHLVRDDASKWADEEQLLRPRFSLEESRISFRVQRYTESAAERVSLAAAGFECEPVDGRAGHLCWREFWTWDRVREFFGDAGGRGLLGVLVRGREKIFGEAVGRATQLVLDHSIESIERALDKEIARVVTLYLERYATARDVVAGRLHKGLF